jgi:hypothetical protein
LIGREQDARLGVVVGRAHHPVPQRAALTPGRPTAVVALEGAALDQGPARARAVHQLHRALRGQRLHEGAVTPTDTLKLFQRPLVRLA